MLSKSLLLPRLANSSVLRSLQTSSFKLSSHELEYWWGPEKNNGREVVGFGMTGDETYMDRLDFWYPAIRFRKDDNVILPIREKEKNDWINLSLDEKKVLYRYAFRQTLAEFEAPTGHWKLILSVVFSVLSLPLLYLTFLKVYVWPPLPQTFDNEWKEMQIEKMLVLEKGQFLGPAKYFDYENNKWKN